MSTHYLFAFLHPTWILALCKSTWEVALPIYNQVCLSATGYWPLESCRSAVSSALHFATRIICMQVAIVLIEIYTLSTLYNTPDIEGSDAVA